MATGTGQCLAIATHLSHQTKPYIKILFLKNHLNHPGQCRVTQASIYYFKDGHKLDANHEEKKPNCNKL